MGHPKLSRFIAVGIFIISLITFILTVQSSVPFWDCGEFIATTYTMAVPHPRGRVFPDHWPCRVDDTSVRRRFCVTD